jgi:two-component sensor histidine kinase
MAEAIRDRDVFECEHRIRQADGSIGSTFSRAIPIMMTAGYREMVRRSVRHNGSKRREELIKQLTLEVHHRLKNILAMVQAIANGTFRSRQQAGS